MPLAALLAAGCSLGAVEVGGGFRDGEEESGAPDESTGDASSGDASSGDDPSIDEGSSSSSGAPPDEPPIDEAGPLQAAFTACAFNLVWTKDAHSGYGRGLSVSMVASADATTLAFIADGNNRFVFPGIKEEAALTLELLEIDAVTGEYVLGGQVVSASVVLALPALRIDPVDPIVLTDATVQDPAGVGIATLTSLVDDTQESFEIQWGLVVDLNGSDNPACKPLLEAVYGPY